MSRPPVSNHDVCNTSSFNGGTYTIPVYLVVDCSLDGVKLRALVDTGSMRSFVNDKIVAVIDFHRVKVREETPRCMSITGDPLNIFGNISVSVKFSKSPTDFKGKFLVCSYMNYDCVLGWNFLVKNGLDLRGDFCRGKRSYYLVGAHGKTPILQDAVGERHVSGVVEMGEEQMVTLDANTPPLFVESRLRGRAKVV